MKISVIIPSRDRAALLARTLEFLSAQLEASHDYDLEVVVANDGSTDSTAEVVDSYTTRIPGLLHAYRAPCPSDLWSCSRGRNLGIKKSTGQLLVFLDAGVIVPPCFIGEIANHFATKPLPRLEESVLVHYVYGYRATREDLAGMESITPQALGGAVDAILSNPRCVDTREPLFSEVGDRLNMLAAPWALAWGMALTVPRALVSDLQGFDEEFTGWGGEDSDFAYRLYRLGAQFGLSRTAYGVHLHHPPAGDAEKAASVRTNLNKMHRKFNALDTELFPVLGPIQYEHILRQVKSLPLGTVLPRYSPTTLAAVNQLLPRPPGCVLLVGNDRKDVLVQLSVTHALVPRASAHVVLMQARPDVVIDECFGYQTRFPDKHFASAIATDFIRWPGQEIQLGMLRELCRISEEVLVLVTPGWKPKDIRDSWTGLEELRDVALETGSVVELVPVAADSVVLRIVPSR